MISRIIDQIEAEQMRQDLPEIEIGDTVRVHLRITEGEGKDRRSRIQVFEGVVIGRQGRGTNDMLNVRRVTYGIGVERIFPVHAPNIEKFEVTRKGDVRRAKLYYLRDRVGKAAKVKERSRWATPRPTKAAVAAAAAAAAAAAPEVAEEAAPAKPAKPAKVKKAKAAPAAAAVVAAPVAAEVVEEAIAEPIVEAATPEVVAEPVAEAIVAEPVVEALVAEVAPEPEPVVAEVAPEPEPEPVVAEAEAAPEAAAEEPAEPKE